MQVIPLQPIPNQQFTIVLDNNRWDIGVKLTDGTISVTLSLNNALVAENLRAVAFGRIIPAQYQEAGNFGIATQNGEIPDYTKFGVTQYLVYISAAELAVLRTPAPPPITPAFFDPLGALPLRYEPKGYA